MISPHVRRLRLAAELLALRQQRHMSSEQLARAVHLPRTTISRLENGRVRPDANDVMRILEELDVSGEQWTKLVTIAREAGERGWWESFADEMGARQALYANLEAGAQSIREYQMTLLPGLLQTPAYTDARAVADKAEMSARFDPTRAVEARAGRQRMLHRPGGPEYHVIIDELAVRRPAADGDTLHKQLLHIVGLATNNPAITVRVLLVDRPIEGHAVPRSGFSIYHYPDPDDPEVVAVDTVTDDLIFTKADQVTRYRGLYDQLMQAALPPVESVRFLEEAADQILQVTGSSA